MSLLFKELGLARLSVKDKLALIGELWDDLNKEENHIPLTDAQLDEVRRRAKEADENPEDLVTWEETKTVMRKILER